jgi:hypothetical protein
VRRAAAHLLGLARGARPDLEGGDAEAVLQLAGAHEVAALGHVWLRGNADAPPELARGFKQVYQHHTVRNEVLVRDLGAVANALAGADVDAVFFKGPWVAFAAYPEPGARPVGDIDVAIHERDYPRARDALGALGYDVHGLPRTSTAALDRAHHGGQLRLEARGRRMVELHFRMIGAGPPARTEDWMWERRTTLELEGVALSVPGPEAMLLHLLFHANQHGFALLRLFFDVRYALEAFAAGGGFDERAFLSLVSSLRFQASAYHGLLLARDLAGASVPTSTLDALRPGRVRRALFGRLWGLDRARRLDTKRGRQHVELPRLYLLEMGRLRDKVRYVTSVATWHAANGAAR